MKDFEVARIRIMTRRILKDLREAKRYIKVAENFSEKQNIDETLIDSKVKLSVSQDLAEVIMKIIEDSKKEGLK